MASSLDTVRERLRRFAEYEAAEASPLYSHLAARAATDDDVAALLTAASGNDAHPTLLLAAAHRLLQSEPIHPLTRYYPSLGGLDGPDDRTWPLFREFVLERATAMRELVATRYTQTNEVGRAAVLYPAVASVAKRVRGAVGLLEVGCSAGLLLGMDTFSYRYLRDGGEQITAGQSKAAVGLHCALSVREGAVFPALPRKMTVGARVGLDRSPVDASDEDELAWLEACVWADQPDRVRLLRTAAAAQRRHRPELVTGDAVDDLAVAATKVPAELPLIVFTSHALPYLPAARRDDFVAALRELATRRRLWWVAMENYEAGLRHVLPGHDELAYGATGKDTVGVVSFDDGKAHAELKAQAVPHGQRMTWLAG
ncbi:DUF2332 domain-containing protein [Saccharomonospora xinjiangensis]|uniref:DUF2332 domain-containing protein n=1 Tax=Saccharomonospora xinjiangensis TaxID=75294 RepID=UPI00106F2A2C|nr:DUF2332 domain-containing protein [Saccharomonospora xinjiangensis]QBQ59115.1 hypothetical protein EYD13_03675 [Saccharomonospora xinjiangensis]